MSSLPSYRRVAVGTKFRTGQVCLESGVYAFAGYIDGSYTPAPRDHEREIPLAANNIFPPINSANKGCFWQLIRYA